MEWQSIETAPSDEVILVCGFAKKGYFVADAIHTQGEWLLFDPLNDEYGVEFDTPSAWMPLPAPPKQD